MKIIIACDTFAGEVTKKFETPEKAFEFMQICFDNHVEFEVRYEYRWQELIDPTTTE